MSNTNHDQHDIEMLMEKILEGKLDSNESHRLEKLLSGQPDRIKSYLLFLNLHVALEEEGAVLAEANIKADLEERSFSEKFEATSLKRTVSKPTVISTVAPKSVLPNLSTVLTTPLIVSFVVLILLGSYIWSNQGPSASLVATADAEWEDSVSRDDFELGQDCVLKSGFVALQFRSGAEVVIEGPAQFRVLNKNAVALDRGRLVALCETKSTHGFTVKVPQGRIVDLGTEFGVESNEDESTYTFVFDGEVQVFPSQASSENSYVIREGESLLFDKEKSLTREDRKNFSLKSVSELHEEVDFKAVHTNQ